jgi:hypothetical protein
LACSFLSLTVPWLVTKLFVEQFYSPLEIIRTLSYGNLQISNSNNNGIGNDPIFLDVTSLYKNSLLALIFSMAMYPISLAIMVISIVLLFISRNKNKKEDKWSRPTRNGGWSVMTLVTGILCIISAIAWIYSIQSFKTQLAE